MPKGHVNHSQACITVHNVIGFAACGAPVTKAASWAWLQEIHKMMTRYCSGRAVKANKSLEQEVTRQRDVAELKAHVLKNKLLASKTANDQVLYTVLTT